MEVEIEGWQPWARGLPTWKPFGVGNPTGYHFSMWLFVLLLAHSIFVFTNFKWSFRNELTLLALFFLAGTVEDFLWHVVNPDWNWWLFTKTCSRWYINYPIWIIVAGVLLLLGGRLKLYPTILAMLLFLTLTFTLISGFWWRKISRTITEYKVLPQFYDSTTVRKLINEAKERRIFINPND
ncbi:MAG: hypothetical protein ACK413_00375 [Patescibacteria group bacterium]